MPGLSVLFIRTALIYLLIGFSLGALLLVNKAYLVDSRIWQLVPVHFFILFLGWVLQLVFGVAFWIMPKFFDNTYGNTKLAGLSYILLNSGLISVSFLYTSLIFTSNFKSFFIPAALMIILGIICFIIYVWSRIKPVIEDLSGINYKG